VGGLISCTVLQNRKWQGQTEKETILSIEFLSDLENKVDSIIKNYEQLRQENSVLKEDVARKAEELAKIEQENGALKQELETAAADYRQAQEKMKAAAGKIQGLIAKIEGV
jgi:FtsZ-binding cell division protein ZapB